MCSLSLFFLPDCNLEMGLKSGMVFGVPIPESHAPLGTQIEAAIQQALQDAKYVCRVFKNFKVRNISS